MKGASHESLTLRRQLIAHERKLLPVRRPRRHIHRSLSAKQFRQHGNLMVFVTYDASVKGHPENKDVMLRMMTVKDKKITVLAKLFGGQGTMNVPSWSPDGKQFAFVSYQLAAKGQ